LWSKKALISARSAWQRLAGVTDVDAVANGAANDASHTKPQNTSMRLIFSPGK